MIRLMPEFTGRTIGLTASGEVTAEDYERVLMPEVESRLRDHERIRMLYRIGPDFAGFTLGAMWDDARLGLAHFSAWERVAVVTDVEWIRSSVGFFRFMMPCPVRVFAQAELAQAKEWIEASTES